MPYVPTDVVTSEDEFRSKFVEAHATQQAKIIDHLDESCRVWIERSPFLVMSTVDNGGAGGCVPERAIPPASSKCWTTRHSRSRTGRATTASIVFRTSLQTGRIGLVFLVPNRNEVVRINGSAQVVRDQALREQMAIKNRVPEFAIVRTGGRGVLSLRQGDHPLGFVETGPGRRCRWPADVRRGAVGPFEDRHAHGGAGAALEKQR